MSLGLFMHMGDRNLIAISPETPHTVTFIREKGEGLNKEVVILQRGRGYNRKQYLDIYSSDSQPGVRVPLGVRKHTAGGTWKHLIITCVTLYFLRIINMGVLMV